MRVIRTVFVAVAAGALISVPGLAAAAPGTADTEVTVGSDDRYFSHNKQNEPGVAVNPVHPMMVAAGANDNIDLEQCNAGDPKTCPFTAGVGVSGIQLSTNGGATWTQPTYSGYSARNPSCRPAPLSSTGCVPTVGPIGTLPEVLRERTGLQRRPGAGLRAGARCERAVLVEQRTAALLREHRDEVPREGAVQGGRRDRGLPQRRLRRHWRDPVIVTKQNSALFSDKEQIWADNASSSCALRKRVRLQRGLPRRRGVRARAVRTVHRWR